MNKITEFWGMWVLNLNWYCQINNSTFKQNAYLNNAMCIDFEFISRIEEK